MEWCGDAKDGHDDSLVLLVYENFHVSDVFFSGHLRDVLIRHVRFSRPKGKTELTLINDHKLNYMCEFTELLPTAVFRLEMMIYIKHAIQL